VHPICKQRFDLMINEQDMPFQSEEGCALIFLINVQHDFED
jgi:hypothetical protein